MVEASEARAKAPLDLLKQAGAISSAYQFHWRRFLFEHFPKGHGLPALEAPPIREELPLAAVQAFSIDDSATTEIDDALSVQGLGSGTVVFGIHIAAPGLAIAPDSALDQVARDRAIPPSTCRASRSPCCPTMSCSLTPCSRDAIARRCRSTSPSTRPPWRLKETVTRLERVPIAANLRHDKLDGAITEPR